MDAIFTGGSSYAKDFQNVITRAVSIASLPINQLTAEKTALSSQNDELKTIDQKVAAVQTALDSISQALTSSFDTTSSNPAVVEARVGAGAAEGNYSILVSDAGAYSTMMTKTWAAAVGAAHTYQLSIGANTYDVTPADNSAVAVAAAINKSYGDKVHATVVNVGPSDAPDYRISMQSVALTSDLLDIGDGGSLQESQTAGKPAQYEVNDSGITVSSSRRTISIADGVNLTLKTSSADPVNLTVTRSTSALNTALAGFVTAYNAVLGELDAQRGTASGALQGDQLVSQISSALSGLATYHGGGAFSGLRDLGLELQKDGTLTQNQFQLIAMDLDNTAGVTSFFESFLTDARAIMDGLKAPVKGTIAAAQADYQSRLSALTKTIADKQAKVDDLQLRLMDQMAKADAMLASMEQQYSYMSSMFQAMQSKQNG